MCVLTCRLGRQTLCALQYGRPTATTTVAVCQLDSHCTQHTTAHISVSDKCAEAVPWCEQFTGSNACVDVVTHLQLLHCVAQAKHGAAERLVMSVWIPVARPAVLHFTAACLGWSG
jgi:hypothetical protein